MKSSLWEFFVSTRQKAKLIKTENKKWIIASKLEGVCEFDLISQNNWLLIAEKQIFFIAKFRSDYNSLNPHYFLVGLKASNY